MGDVYLHGLGVAEDPSEAAEWYRKSADQGNPEAEDTLGCMYMNGSGVERDYEKAFALFRAATEQG